MFELHDWWAGAARRPWAGWGELIRRRGGIWDDLGEVPLEDLNIPPEVVARWRDAEPIRSRGRPIRLCDPQYPAPLRKLVDAPAVLFVEGDLAVLAERMVAVVGTRRCSPAGEQLAFQVGRALAAAGLVVVSGMAHGIDAAAHRGALRAGRTVAVVGHGLSATFPAAHRGLRQEISLLGAVVTAFPDGVSPARWTFPERNRWLAGLCDALVVIEAPAASGALITALVASELARPIYAFPGAAGSPVNAGGHMLLRSKDATLVDSPRDLTEILAPSVPGDPEIFWRSALFRGEPLEEVARLRGGSTLELLCELQRMEVRGEVVRLPARRYVDARGKA